MINIIAGLFLARKKNELRKCSLIPLHKFLDQQLAFTPSRDEFFRFAKSLTSYKHSWFARHSADTRNTICNIIPSSESEYLKI